MNTYINDVAYWVEEWEATGALISGQVARKIAEFWASSGEGGALAAFASGELVTNEALLDDIEGTIRYARSAAGLFTATIGELYALKDWALCKLEQ